MSQNPILIPGLDALFMVEGQVFAHFDAEPDASALLRLGAAEVPMSTVAPESLEGFSFVARDGLNTEDLPRETRSVPAESAPGEVYALWVNHLADWALPGSKTIQLMLTDRSKPARIEIDRPLRTRTDLGAGMDPDREDATDVFFHARLGTHRADARLHVTITDTQSGESETHPVAFEPAWAGGRSEDGYQKVTLALPTGRAALEIRLGVEYLGYLDDGSETEPFVFISDVHTGPRDSGSGQRDPRRILSPHIVALNGKLPRNGTWLSAHIPALPAPGQTAHLDVGPKTASIPLPEEINLHMCQDFGHTIVMESNRKAELALCVDGRIDKIVSVTPGENALRMNAAYLDGTTHSVSLRDASGSLTYWSGQILAPAVLTPADVMQRESVAPFPDAIFPQTTRRYGTLKAQMARMTPDTDLAQLCHVLATVEGGHEKVRLDPLHFPEVTEPDVSIVIPAHNKVNVTYLALCSLLLADNKASFEVIVVDDASSDETARLEDIVSGITVMHNVQPQRFIRACNAGAAKARGDYIVLLNNDVEVTGGWLDELIATFTRFDNVGLAGAKLLYPDGSLQDGGGMIWGSGNPWNYGNRQNANAPDCSYARQADYLSGAAMMVPRKVWEEVEGLSAYLEPMYFEDTDFAFKVRAAGYSTWFVPSSVIYHYEGMTSGTDVSTGFKRYQEVNRPKFKRRWAEAYQGFGREGHRPDLEKDRGIIGRVLFIDYTTPRPDQDAGSYAALQEIRMVQSLGYKVTFLPANMAYLGHYTEELQRMGVEVIYAPFFMTPREYLDRHAADFDAFYLTRYYVAQQVLPQIRLQAPEARILFNNADLHFLREIRAAQAEGSPERLEQARQTRASEIGVIEKVDVVLSYNDMEHSVIEAYTEGRAKVMRTPWVVDVPEASPPLSTRKGLSFLGSFQHHPNTEGILWFARDVMPQLAARCDTVLSIYGSRMQDEIKALASDVINPAGFVTDVAEAYDRHRIFVAPLRSGAGIKGKVLSALAHGIPCVLSPVAAEGIGLRSGHDCFVAHTPEDWIEAIIRLTEDDELWQTLSDNARTYMASDYSFERGCAAMREVFEAADLYRRPNPPPLTLDS